MNSSPSARARLASRCLLQLPCAPPAFAIEEVVVTATRVTRAALTVPLGFDQDEIADTAGVYLQNEFAVTDAVNLQAGLRYELAWYDMRVEDEVTPVINVAGRAFFNNAETDRKGVEVGLEAEVLAGLDFTLAYTYTDLAFDRFASNVGAEGEHLPGVPRHYAYFELDYQHSSGLYVKWDWAHVGSLYADNLNLTRVGSYDVSNLVFGRDFRFGRLTVMPNFGINNLFDEDYNQEIRIEDSTSRFFAPAPDRNIFGGVRLRYDFDI